jgi:hypothetical protein
VLAAYHTTRALNRRIFHLSVVLRTLKAGD